MSCITPMMWGFRKGRLELIKSMVDEGLPPDTIAKITQLPLEDVQKPINGQ